jgi:trimethylamine--corrinoid protein Co-methyltransferase
MVREALTTAPGRILIYDRCGQEAMLLEEGRVYFGSGSDTPWTIDVWDGRRRAAEKRDVAKAAVVADALDDIDFVMSMGIAGDVPKATSYLHQFEAMLLNTTKPIIFTADGERDAADILSMAEVATGSREQLKATPFVILYAEPSSPLQHSRTAAAKLLLCARRGVPVVYIPTVMLGATGPVTSAGALAVANAEALSGLVMHQLASPGAPFIYGGSAPPMDMRTMICSYGAAEAVLNDAFMIAMSRHYRLPVFCTAGCSDAQTFDQQAGMEAGYSLLFLSLAGGNLIHDLGYIGAGATSSMEMLVLCDETAGMLRRSMRGLDISPETLALDVVERVGPGGNFLAETHTLEHYKSHLYFTELLNRRDHDSWRKVGARDYGQRAADKVRQIIEHHRPRQLDKTVVQKVRAIVADRDAGQTRKPDDRA